MGPVRVKVAGTASEVGAQHQNTMTASELHVNITAQSWQFAELQ